MLNVFAGPVFPNESYYSIALVSLLVIIALLTLIIFIVWKLTSRKKTLTNKKAFSKSLLLSSVFIVCAILIFFVIPTVIEDAQYKRKQSECAKKVGYSSPADDNSSIATASSQELYRECINNDK